MRKAVADDACEDGIDFEVVCRHGECGVGRLGVDMVDGVDVLGEDDDAIGFEEGA